MINLKNIIIKIKENNKSYDQQIKDIKKNIKSYQDKIVNSERMLSKYDSKIKDYDVHKNILEKQKIDLKQGYDKLNWKYNEMSENLNANNVSISTLETQMSLSEDNINKLKVNIDILTSKKQEILSDSRHPIKLDTKNKLNELINKKRKKKTICLHLLKIK